jgi:thymidylate synthase (FAD)
MHVQIIEGTPNPERTVCKAARNDYRERGLSENSYEEIMASVDGDTTEEKEETLLRHLFKKQHYGPFEHIHASFNIEGMSRVVMAQATRHRLLSWDIQSQRYVDFSDPEYTVPESFTNPDHFTRDDGTVELTEDELDDELIRYESAVEDNSVEAYNRLVESGIPKEDARYVLPTAMEVNAVMSGNLRALLHVLNMRSKANVQSETRELVGLIEEEVAEWVPTIYEFFDNQRPMKLGL